MFWFLFFLILQWFFNGFIHMLWIALVSLDFVMVSPLIIPMLWIALVLAQHIVWCANTAQILLGHNTASSRTTQFLVSLVSPFCLPNVSLLSLSLSPSCLPSVSLCLPLSPSYLASVSLLSPFVVF